MSSSTRSPDRQTPRVLVVPQRTGRPPAPEAEPAARYDPALSIDCILAFALNPRTEFEEEPLAELAASIGRCGVLQPILVRTGVNRHGRQFYDLVAGERRLRAAQQAGLTTVPAIIRREMLHTDAVFAALAENMFRQDLTSIEIAQSVQMLRQMSSPPLTQEKIAKQMGLNSSNLSGYLRLLELPASVQVLIRDRRLVFASARALYYYWRAHPDIDVLAAAQIIAEEKISCKALERDFAFAVFGTSPAEPVETEQLPVPAPSSTENRVTPTAISSTKPTLLETDRSEEKRVGRECLFGREEPGDEARPTENLPLDAEAPEGVTATKRRTGSEKHTAAGDLPTLLPYLTRTERIVLNLYVQAHTTKEITSILNVDDSAVLIHVAHIKQKLNARSLAHVLVRIGAIRLPPEYAMPEDWDPAETPYQRASQGKRQGKGKPHTEKETLD